MTNPSNPYPGNNDPRYNSQTPGPSSNSYGQQGQPYSQHGQPYGQHGQPYGQQGQPYGAAGDHPYAQGNYGASRGEEPKKNKSLPIIIGVVVALIIGAIAVWALTRGGDDDPTPTATAEVTDEATTDGATDGATGDATDGATDEATTDGTEETDPAEETTPGELTSQEEGGAVAYTLPNGDVSVKIPTGWNVESDVQGVEFTATDADQANFVALDELELNASAILSPEQYAEALETNLGLEAGDVSVEPTVEIDGVESQPYKLSINGVEMAIYTFEHNGSSYELSVMGEPAIIDEVISNGVTFN